jgi:hypothetical protein
METIEILELLTGFIFGVITGLGILALIKYLWT